MVPLRELPVLPQVKGEPMPPSPREWDLLVKALLDGQERIETNQKEHREELKQELRQVITSTEQSLLRSQAANDIRFRDLQAEHRAALQRQQEAFAKKLEEIKEVHTQHLEALSNRLTVVEKINREQDLLLSSMQVTVDAVKTERIKQLAMTSGAGGATAALVALLSKYLGA